MKFAFLLSLYGSTYDGEWNHSMSFLALKNLLKYSTCQVANPNRQHIENMLKNNTLLFVDSENRKENGEVIKAL